MPKNTVLRSLRPNMDFQVILHAASHTCWRLFKITTKLWHKHPDISILNRGMQELCDSIFVCDIFSNLLLILFGTGYCECINVLLLVERESTVCIIGFQENVWITYACISDHWNTLFDKTVNLRTESSTWFTKILAEISKEMCAHHATWMFYTFFYSLSLLLTSNK